MLRLIVASIVLCLLITKMSAFNCSSPFQVNPEECCNSVPQYISKELLNECKLNGKDECEPFNCILRKKLLLGMDDKLDKVALKKYVVKDQSDDWKMAIETTLQSCIDVGDGDSCEARVFIGCFMHNIYKNCPPSSWTSSGDCRAAKEFFQNCKPIVS